MRILLKRALPITAALALTLRGQNTPSFEVATIKPAPPITAAMAAAGKFHVGMKVDGAQVDIGYTPLSELIRIAYQVKPYQISGPDWMVYDKWDILAKLPEGASPSEVPAMLRTLLADRFKLSVHRENRDGRIYALEVAADGSKLKPSPGEESSDKPMQILNSRDGNSTTVSGAGFGVTRTEMHPDGSMHLESSKMTLPLLADALSAYLDPPVIDQTHLTGNYQMELEFSAADLRYAAAKAGYPSAGNPQAANAGASEPVGASLLASVRKLGLKLEQRQAPIEMIVVDHLEKTPSAN